jgi:hypothetical protein
MERIQIGGRHTVGFGVGTAQDDPCSIGVFQGFYGKSIELPVLKAENEQNAQYMDSLNAAISGSCPTMRDVDKQAWQAVFRKWQMLHTAIQTFLADPPWIGYNLDAAKWMCRLNNVRDQANTFQSMSIQCNPQETPNVPPPPKPSPSSDWFGFASPLSTATTIATGIAVLTGIAYLTPIVRPIIGRLLPTPKRSAPTT